MQEGHGFESDQNLVGFYQPTLGSGNAKKKKKKKKPSGNLGRLVLHSQVSVKIESSIFTDASEDITVLT